MEHERFSPEAPRAGMSGCTMALIGCGGVLLLLIIAIGAGVWYISNNFRSIASGAVSTVVKKAVEESELAPDQKQKIIARVEQVSTDYAAGKITDEQMQNVLEHIVASPLMHLGAIEFYEERYIEPSELTADEKTAAKRTLERFARGMLEKKLTIEDLKQVNAPISTTNSDGEQELKDKPTTAELRQMLKLAQDKVNAAGVPDEPFQIDVAAELDRAVAAGLAGEKVPEFEENEASDEQLPAEDPEQDVPPLEVEQVEKE